MILLFVERGLVAGCEDCLEREEAREKDSREEAELSNSRGRRFQSETVGGKKE